MIEIELISDHTLGWVECYFEVRVTDRDTKSCVDIKFNWDGEKLDISTNSDAANSMPGVTDLLLISRVAQCIWDNYISNHNTYTDIFYDDDGNPTVTYAINNDGDSVRVIQME